MILKILAERENEQGEVDWVYIDKVAKVKVAKIGPIREGNMGRIDYDMVYLVKGNKAKESRYKIVIGAHFENGAEKTIMSNSSIFLLNDEGKTIERL